MSNILVTNFGKARLAAGINSVEKLPEVLKAGGIKKPLIVSDKKIADLDKFKRTIHLLEKSDLKPCVYSNVTPNPKDYEVMEATRIYSENGCDGVIGIGGGSSMDASKGVSAMVRHEGDIMDYGRSTPNRKYFTNGREPLFCIPTTTGTGSELSPHAVITNTKRNNRKSDIMDTLFYCDMFFLDPEFACTQPIETIRDTGVDALSHMIDSYTNRKMVTTISPLHEALGLKCVELISNNLRQVIATAGQNLEGVLALQWGATFGGAMLDLDASLIHGISGALQKYRHEMTHGVSCGIVMSACMNYNLQTSPKKFAQIAEAMGVDTSHMNVLEAAKASVKAVENLLDDVDFPTMACFNYTDDELEQMAEISAGNSMMPLNARPIRSKEDILNVYRYANSR